MRDDADDADDVRVVLVDGRPDRRGVVRYLVEGIEAVVVVGEAGTQAHALTCVDESRADVVVLDIQMPLDEGLATVAALRAHSPRLGIIVCSFHVDPDTKRRALDLGADAYLDKPVSALDVTAALRRLQLVASAAMN